MRGYRTLVACTRRAAARARARAAPTSRSVTASTGRSASRPQGQTPLVVVLTEARPIALMETERSCEPTVGVERQIVNVSVVAPTPEGWKNSATAPPAGVTRKPVGAFCTLCSGMVPAPVVTIHPCDQLPAPQVAPSAETHSVTTASRLIASLRASCAAPTSEFATERNLLGRLAFVNEGAARASSTARIAIATSISTSVKPRFCRVFRAFMLQALLTLEIPVDTGFRLR